jgi:hypothetical protein
VTETEVARIERDELAGTADLGLRLTETKQLMPALQDQIVPAQVAVVAERRRSCVSCGRRLASKGYYPVTFRSLFGDEEEPRVALPTYTSPLDHTKHN